MPSEGFDIQNFDSTLTAIALMSPETPSPLNLPPDSPPVRILIVEDDPMMQLGLEQSLAAHPQKVILSQTEYSRNRSTLLTEQ
ncbi:hypothetical protein LAY41_11425 [Argonema galeatum A003/A1]|nr:hypothetical protein [Argonema galeatum A003/A1]